MLRDYQIQAIGDIRRQWQRGNKKVMLHLSTGAGKTVIFSEAMKRTVAGDRKAAMLVRGRKLVSQASERLFREGVFHGVLMAGHPLYKPHAPIQICSIDTIRSRGVRPRADLLVIDEAHLCTSDRDREIIEGFNDSYILSVTATPFTKKPLTHMADTIICPIDFNGLVEKGYLVPPKMFAPSAPNLEGIKTVSGDYEKRELYKRCAKNVLVGDIITHWQKFAKGVPTICFAVNIDHSKQIVDTFKKAGISAEHIEANNSDSQREAALKRLENGQTKIVSNVGILCTGVDLPWLKCIIMARPTKSFALYIQQLGRGTRPFSNKHHFICLDHAGNCKRHGFINDKFEPNLKGNQPKREIRPVKICKQCYAAYDSPSCPNCGAIHKPSNTQESIHTENGELVEMSRDIIQDYFDYLKRVRENRGYKNNWIWYKLSDRFGPEIADKFHPGFGIDRDKLYKGKVGLK